MIDFQERLNSLLAATKQDQYPEVDCIVNIGHSIGQGKNGLWYLSLPAQPIKELGLRSDGSRIFLRTARIESSHRLFQSEHSIVGGGVFAAVATAELYRQLDFEDKAPYVLHTGGRPAYLEESTPDQPHLTEGILMQFILINAHGSIQESDKLLWKMENKPRMM